MFHMTSHFESSPGSSDEQSQAAAEPIRSSQPTWAASPPVGCYCLHPPSPLLLLSPRRPPTEKFYKTLKDYEWLKISIYFVWLKV